METIHLYTLYRPANLRVGHLREIVNVAIFGSMIMITYIYETGENWATISSFSHSNGPILVG